MGKKGVWVLITGRRWGKTLCGSFAILDYAMSNPGVTIGVIAPTYTMLKRTNFRGKAGLLKNCPKCWIKRADMSSSPELELINGSIIYGFTAERPDSFRGSGLNAIWADEMTAWKYREVWDEMEIVASEGENILMIVTTTPPEMVNNPEMWTILKGLVDEGKDEDSDVIVTRGITLENTALSQKYRDKIQKKIDTGKLRHRVEFLAEILDEVPGALWTKKQLNDCEIEYVNRDDLDRVVVAVDPSGGGPDEVGIIVVGVARGASGRKENDKYYVLADYSGHMDPRDWIPLVKQVHDDWNADCVVYEKNYGHRLVKDPLEAHDTGLIAEPIGVYETKYLRADAESILYDEGKVFHVGKFEKLKEQMITFHPNSKGSPDRLDALTLALKYLRTLLPHEFHWNSY